MVNLRAAANVLTRGINPNIAPGDATVRRYTGWATSSAFKRVAAYALPQPIELQVQALKAKEIEHLDKLNISDATRAVYANGQLKALNRNDQTGGDLLQFEGAVWLVVAVLEGWTTAGWCKVAVVEQTDDPT